MSNEKIVKLTNAPVYANVYVKLVPVARAHGYALAVHGSMVRDLDLIAVPWVVGACDASTLVEALSHVCAFDVRLGPEAKEHGRMVWTLAFPGQCFVDLSVMPKTNHETQR